MSFFARRNPNTAVAALPATVFVAAETDAAEIPVHTLNKGLILYGSMSFEGQMILRSTVSGDIDGDPGSELIVETDGTVEGGVSCSRVVVRGSVEGNITADQVTVERTGRVTGIIRAAVFGAEPGAKIHGQVLPADAQAAGNDDSAA